MKRGGYCLPKLRGWTGVEYADIVILIGLSVMGVGLGMIHLGAGLTVVGAVITLLGIRRR